MGESGNGGHTGLDDRIEGDGILARGHGGRDLGTGSEGQIKIKLKLLIYRVN